MAALLDGRGRCHYHFEEQTKETKLRSTPLIVTALIAVFTLSLVHGQDIEIAGVLEANDFGLSVLRTVWHGAGTPFPFVESTPGWSGQPGAVDTFQFAPKLTWPSRIDVYASFQGGDSLVLEIDSVQPNTWYELPTPSGLDVAPRVMFRDTILLGVSSPGMPKKMPIVRVSPNPVARGYASLHYVLPRAGPVTVSVFDVAGREVLRRSLADGRTGTVSLDLRNLANGVYPVRLDADGHTATRKLVIRR